MEDYFNNDLVEAKRIIKKNKFSRSIGFINKYTSRGKAHRRQRDYIEEMEAKNELESRANLMKSRKKIRNLPISGSVNLKQQAYIKEHEKINRITKDKN